MAKQDVKFDKLQVVEISTDVGEVVIIRNKLQYDRYNTFNNGNDLIDLATLNAAIAGLSAPIKVAFTAASGKVINWQTDEAFTGSTYVEYFGNIIPKPMIMTNTGIANETGKKDFDLKVIEIAGVITTVTFDWATTETGYIIF